MRFPPIVAATFGGVILVLSATFPATAQKTAPDQCLALAENRPAPSRNLIHKARLQLAALKPYQVQVTYQGHSTFTIESAKGVTIATDYNDYVRSASTPMIATMNIAHSSHHSVAPDPGIEHLLPGWHEDGNGKARIHDLSVRDVRIRNVPTNIRTHYAGAKYGKFGNSIFIFEIGGLCMAHLGHLHHTLTTQQLAQIGQMDIVFVPVDGSYTLDTAGMIEVLKSLKAPIVVPMHWFSGYSLEAFITVAQADYEIVRNPGSTIVFSRDQMPPKPRMIVMPPEQG